MPEEEAPKSIKVDYYIELVLRRRWLLIVSRGHLDPDRTQKYPGQIC